MQATMSVIEGYSDFVMHNVGRSLVPQYEHLKNRMARSRAHRPPFETAVFRITGLDVKLEQYRLGERFAEAVARREGHGGPEPRLGASREPADPRRGQGPRDLDDQDGGLLRWSILLWAMSSLGKTRPGPAAEPRPALRRSGVKGSAHLQGALERQLPRRGRFADDTTDSRLQDARALLGEAGVPVHPDDLEDYKKATDERGAGLPDWIRRFFGGVTRLAI